MAARGLTWAALACAALAWVLLAVGDARESDVRLGARLGEERVDAHARALRGAAARLAGLEALPPELLARTLAEVALVYPDFARLLVVDRRGVVLAAWPKRDTALVGAADPSEARRAALVGKGTGALADAPFAHERGGGTVELGVAAARAVTGAERPREVGDVYVAGDLPHIEPRLGAAPTPSRVIASWVFAACAVLLALAEVMVARRLARS